MEDKWYDEILESLARFSQPSNQSGSLFSYQSGSVAKSKQSSFLSKEKEKESRSLDSFPVSVKMSASSSSSDSEGSSSSEDAPKVTTRSERIIKRYQVKKSLIQERIFAIEQVKLVLISLSLKLDLVDDLFIQKCIDLRSVLTCTLRKSTSS